MLTAVRDSRAVGDSTLRYLLRGDEGSAAAKDRLIVISESSSKVDGIGGIVWEGALVLCEALRRLCRPEAVMLIELGAGTGLCGIVAAARGMDAVVTDREVDLAEENVQRNLVAGAIQVVKFDWSEELPKPLEHLSTPVGRRKVVVGVEVACLLKQQPFLVEALKALSDPQSIILITFDAGSSRYETAFLQRMCDEGFLHKKLYSGKVIFTDFAPVVQEEQLVLDIPPPAPGVKRSYGLLEHGSGYAFPTDADCCVSHNVALLYKQSAVSTCRCCYAQFFEALNNDSACQHHSGYFVCRRHPAELRCSIDGKGDGLGYYGNGAEGELILIFYTGYLLLFCFITADNIIAIISVRRLGC